ncbi:unnamed protein product, partial [Iphiclides podalirius]
MIVEAHEELIAERREQGKKIVKRYPYDAASSPAYEITYAHQCIAVTLAASLNVSLDILVTTLMCQCRCRLRLLALSLKTLCDEIPGHTATGLRNIGVELFLIDRLRSCIKQHQAALNQARLLQAYFSAPIFGQFSVSMIIICVTAYQLAFSEKIKVAAYEWPWYSCGCRVRRVLLIIVERSHRVVRLRAGGLTELTLASFMAVSNYS